MTLIQKFETHKIYFADVPKMANFGLLEPKIPILHNRQ